jgi:WhiB family redox-sensing transcriptional regulator
MSDYLDQAALDGHPAFMVPDSVPCAETDPEAYFPEEGGLGSHARAVNALKVCSTCPVLQQCFDYAYKDARIVGIWGGTTSSQRATMRRGALKEGPFPTR